MNMEKLAEVFAHADDPAATAMRWWANAYPRTPGALEVLQEVFSRHGRIRDAAALRSLGRGAEGWAGKHAEQVPAVAESLLTVGSPGAMAAAASLWEAIKEFARAADLFESLADLVEGEVKAVCLLGLARNRGRLGRRLPAADALAAAVRESASNRTLSGAASLLRQWEKEGELPSRRRCRIGIVGNVTFDMLVSLLRVACFAQGIRAECWTGAFGQHVQEILDPGSGLAAFKPDIVIIACDWRVLGLPEETAAPEAMVQTKVAEFQSLWQTCRDRLAAHVIQFGFEVPAQGPYGRLSAALAGGMGRVIREINRAWFDAENLGAGLTILDIDQIAGCAGKRIWSAPALWFVAKQHPSAEALPELVRSLTATIRGVLGLTAKCLVLDLDGTLWGGVIGEDGLQNIRLGGANAGEAFATFQKYVASLKRRGILLAVCSKNNEADARAPFESHPEMVLKLEDITLFVANWKSKDENLRHIAQTLNIGLDSLVFVDDNPVERRWIRRQLPEVEVVELPQDPALYIEALERQLPFEALSLSAEDRQRAESYRANEERQVLRATTSTVAEFLVALEMSVDLRPFDEANLARVAQLINKTNQFNLTTRRMSESQVAALIGAKDVYTQMMRLRDRYGDYGLTGVLIAQAEESALRIDSWLLSCRVMGRSIEDAMMAALMREARARGFKEVIGKYFPSGKNGAVKYLFTRLGFQASSPSASGSQRFTWNLDQEPLAFPAGLKILDSTRESM